MSDNVCRPSQQEAGAGIVITCPNLVVCEGESDRQFLFNLAEKRGLSGFQFEIAKKDESDTGGQSKFKKFLIGLNGPVSGFELLSTVILVSDNDTNPDASFRSIQRQIKESGAFKVPPEPFKQAKKRNAPAMFVMMLPWKGKKGTLEHVILEALCDRYSENKRCLDEYCICGSITKPTENKKAKMLAQCMIATLSKDDPNCGISYMWRKKNGFKPLLQHKAFNRIHRFLSRFSI